MANDNTPFGLKPETSFKGSVKRERYDLAAGTTKIFLYDPALIQAAGTVNIGGVTGQLLGSFVGFEDADGMPQSFYPGDSSTGWKALVADDPTQEFLIQEDSVGGAMALADVGLNANLVAGTGREDTGVSTYQLDSSTKATTSALQLRILRFLECANNDVGNYAKWVVRINNHFHAQTTGI